jgi:hypothetical protein
MAKFPANSLHNREFECGAGFALDCIHSQPPVHEAASPPWEHTHALFAARNQSFRDNVVTFFAEAGTVMQFAV